MTRRRMKGYVTTLVSIVGHTATELEMALGFNKGSLAAGFAVWALDDEVAVGDFEWKDRTSYSAGWHFDSTIGEYVQRQDELRAHLGKQHGYSESKTDDAILGLMRAQAKRLAVRVGAERIVKVVAKGRIETFPDSPMRSVPQWKLTVEKEFALLRDVAPGGRFV